MTHPLALDLVEFIDERDEHERNIIAHIVACPGCRQGAINIIQSSKVGYPDLFARPS